MIFLQNDKKLGLWMHLHLAWSVPCFKHSLGKLLSKMLHLDDAQCVVGNRHYPIGTPLGAERTCTGQGFIPERGDSVLPHEIVAEPGHVTESDHSVLPLLLNFGQLDASCA